MRYIFKIVFSGSSGRPIFLTLDLIYSISSGVLSMILIASLILLTYEYPALQKSEKTKIFGQIIQVDFLLLGKFTKRLRTMRLI